MRSKAINIHIPSGVWDKFKQICLEAGISTDEAIKKMIQIWIIDTKGKLIIGEKR